MDMDRVPFIRDPREIDGAAYKLLAGFARTEGVAKIEPPIPVEEIVSNHLKVELVIEDLASTLGAGILGATYPEGRGRISIDESLERGPEGRLVFTIAHEVGHWILHRRLFLAQTAQPSLFDTPACGPAIMCRGVGEQAPRKPRGEYQADRFAGALLMPEDVLRATYVEVDPHGPTTVGAPGAGRVDLIADGEARTLAREMIDRGHFGNVSVAAMVMRLKEVGLLVLAADAQRLGSSLLIT